MLPSAWHFYCWQDFGHLELARGLSHITLLLQILLLGGWKWLITAPGCPKHSDKDQVY